MKRRSGDESDRARQLGPGQKRVRLLHDEGDSSKGGGAKSAASKVMKQVVEEDVLAMIGSNLPATDLRTLLQTCQLWNRAFIPSFRAKHAPIRVTNVSVDVKNDPPAHWKDLDNVNEPDTRTHNLADFNALMKASQKIPFGESYDLWLDGQKKEWPEVDEFITLCGTSARSLRLQLRTGWVRGPEQVLNLTRVRQLVFDKLPNLTVLELSIKLRDSMLISYERKPASALKIQQLTLNFPAFDSHPAQKAILVDLLKGLVDLKSLVVKSRKDWTEPILPIIVQKLKPAQLANLCRCRLELNVQPHAEDLALLNQTIVRATSSNSRPLRLAAFLIKIDLGWITNAAFTHQLYTFLVSQSDSLRLLELKTNREPRRRQLATGGAAIPEIMTIQLPEMAGLRELRLFRCGSALKKLWFQFDAVSLTDNFPNLEKFAYDLASMYYTAPRYRKPEVRALIHDLNILKHERVTSLELAISLPRPVDQMRMIKKLGAGFPSKVNLQLTMAPATLHKDLPEVWSLWPLLETVYIKYDESDPSDENDNGHDNGRSPRFVNLDKPLSGVAHTTSTRTLRRLNTPSSYMNFDPESVNMSAFLNLVIVRAALRISKTQPGLSDMTKLRKLVLDFTETKVIPKLGDVGGYFGLVMASRTLRHFAVLRRFGASNSAAVGNNNISGECEMMIRSVLGPVAGIHL